MNKPLVSKIASLCMIIGGAMAFGLNVSQDPVNLTLILNLLVMACGIYLNVKKIPDK